MERQLVLDRKQRVELIKEKITIFSITITVKNKKGAEKFDFYSFIFKTILTVIIL